MTVLQRELRRVKQLPADAPAHLQAAFSAVNRVVVDGEVQAAAAWDKYIQAQGGAMVGRGYQIGWQKKIKPEPGAMAKRWRHGRQGCWPGARN